MPAAKPANVKAAVLAEHRRGNRTVRGIRDALKRKGIAISIGTVSAYLQAASAASEAIATPARKTVKAKSPPSQASPARAELVAEVRDAAEAHASAWERLHQAHALAVAEIGRRLEGLGRQTACAKCGGGFEAAPDWPTLKSLRAFAGELLADIERLRPVEAKKPEDDPANIEAARITVATLRARIVAHHAAS